MKKYIDVSLDDKFVEIESLKWLPFIGQNYFQQKTRTLVVGESHYLPINEDEEFYNDVSWTRKFILKEGLQIKPWNLSDTKNNLVREVEKTLIGEIRSELWNDLSYFNLIQRLLPSIKGQDRPTSEDFVNGLLTFKEIVGFLNPDRIIFCGVKAGKFFKEKLEDKNFLIQEYKFGKTKINGAYPKSFKFNINNKECLCYFIKHPSSFYTSNHWREFIIEH